jgi:hypothetical protein
VSKGKKHAKARKYSLLIVIKGEHKYLVKYDPGRKSELLDLLTTYAMDETLNLTSVDVLALAEKLENRGTGAALIALDEGRPALERDLTFESPTLDAGEFDIGLDF